MQIQICSNLLLNKPPFHLVSLPLWAYTRALLRIVYTSVLHSFLFAKSNKHVTGVRVGGMGNSFLSLFHAYVVQKHLSFYTPPTMIQRV